MTRLMQGGESPVLHDGGACNGNEQDNGAIVTNTRMQFREVAKRNRVAQEEGLSLVRPNNIEYRTRRVDGINADQIIT